MTNDSNGKSRKPANTAFRQQRLKAWQPILTPKTVLPIFFITGVIFTPLGGLLYYASEVVQEVVIDYTYCTSQALGEFTTIPEGSYSYSFNSENQVNPPSWRVDKNETNRDWDQYICTLQFDIPNDIGPSVLYYYRLTNFYQNHRLYVNSFDEKQINGQPLTLDQVNSDGTCSPLAGENGLPYYPCGLIANSLFNDSIFSPERLDDSGSTETYLMTDQGITWPVDANRFLPSQYNSSQAIPPPNWARMFPNGYEDGIPNIQEWEALQVWMRTAGLPIFSKLALRNDNNAMTAGTYQAVITENFPVIEYDGTKSMVITTASTIGGKNIFLGVAYMTIGGLCIIFGTVFLTRHIIKPRRLGDESAISHWRVF